MSSIDEVESYQWPDIKDFDSSDFEKQIWLYDEFAIEAGLWAPIFHNVAWLCGFENTLGKGGGYILSPSQAFEPDIPVNHLLAMFDEGKKAR